MSRTIFSRTSFRVLLSVVLFGAFESSARSEELEISFANAQTDPLVELFLPPPGSPDTIRFTNEGMSIRQPGDVPGRPTGVAGFKTLLMAQGDFTVTFDFECPRLEQPTQGWGQGIVLAVFLDDEAETILKMAKLACPDRDPFCQVEINSRTGSVEPIYRPHDMEFTEGSFIINRSGDEVTFTVDNGDERRVLETFPCPASDVRGVELGCTRLEQGNTPAEYLLERLHIEADGFFSYQTPKEPAISWWTILITGQLLVLGGLLVVFIRRRGA